MLRTARQRGGVGPLTLSLTFGGLVLTGVVARGDGPPPISGQLTELARQARAQGDLAQARTFYLKAIQLDPTNAAARRGLAASRGVVRVAMQDPPAPAVEAPAIPPGVPSAETPPIPAATLEASDRLANISRQQLTDEIRQRLQTARDLVSRGQPEAALSALRLAKTMVQAAESADQATRDALDRQIQAQYVSTVRDEERIVSERAESQRRVASEEQRTRTLELFERNQSTVGAMMTQFDSLMTQGVYNVLYNGGTGDITAATVPFYDARLLAQQARALVPNDPTPRAGMFVAQTMGFLAQEMAFEALKEYRFMLTMQDVARAAVPFPDGQIIEYPPADRFRAMSERRIPRWGRAVDLLDRDPKTKGILAKLDEPISMNFANETPLEDVLKYIKSATHGANDSGIPIYVDPVGLQEAEKTITSPVTLDLEGVPLKTTLRLILKQLSLTYTVKDGLLTITSDTSSDQPTEIRVYPVADLAIIPLSLMGGGGGMGGGMGGGGMGGGMGGMGGGGMMSMPVQDPNDQPGGFLEKKSS